MCFFFLHRRPVLAVPRQTRRCAPKTVPDKINLIQVGVRCNQLRVYNQKQFSSYCTYCIRRNIRCVLNQRYLRGHPLTANINTSVNLIYNDKGG